MNTKTVAIAFNCSVRTARQMLASKPGDFLYAVWELGPIRCHCVHRQWKLDQRRVWPREIEAAWDRMRARKRSVA